MMKFGLPDSLKNNATRAIASAGGLSAIDELRSVKEAKSKLQDHKASADEKYQLIFNEGIAALKHYAANPVFDTVNLHKAAIKFSEALEIRKHNAEPYFYLAYIFNHLNYQGLAENYYEIARLLNPDLKGLKTLKKFMQEGK